MVSKIKEQMNKCELVGAQPQIQPSTKMVFTAKEKFFFFFPVLLRCDWQKLYTFRLYNIIF